MLVRDVDVSGISGEGVVVWGIVWPDGRCAYRWNTDTATDQLADSIEHVQAIHGHNGATRVVWLDTEREANRWRRYVRLGDGPPPVYRGRGAEPVEAGERGASGGGTAG